MQKINAHCVWLLLVPHHSRGQKTPPQPVCGTGRRLEDRRNKLHDATRTTTDKSATQMVPPLLFSSRGAAYWPTTRLCRALDTLSVKRISVVPRYTLISIIPAPAPTRYVEDLNEFATSAIPYISACTTRAS